MAGFTFVAYFNFGGNVEGFKTPGEAFESLYRMLAGDFTTYDEALRTPKAQMAVLFFYTYQMLVYFLLINILLAILVDSYAGVKDETGDSDTMPEELRKMLVAILDAPPFKPRDERKGDVQLLQALETSLSVLRGEGESDSESDGDSGEGRGGSGQQQQQQQQRRQQQRSPQAKRAAEEQAAAANQRVLSLPSFELNRQRIDETARAMAEQGLDPKEAQAAAALLLQVHQRFGEGTDQLPDPRVVPEAESDSGLELHTDLHLHRHAEEPPAPQSQSQSPRRRSSQSPPPMERQ